MLTTNEEAFSKISEAERKGAEALIERLKNIGYVQESYGNDSGAGAIVGAYLSKGNVKAHIKVRPYKASNIILLTFGTTKEGQKGQFPQSELTYEVLEDRMILTNIFGRRKPDEPYYDYKLPEKGKSQINPTILFD